MTWSWKWKSNPISRDMDEIDFDIEGEKFSSLEWSSMVGRIVQIYLNPTTWMSDMKLSKILDIISGLIDTDSDIEFLKF